jgi:ectoine hydroxylase-related dioxygenase (phytanoyl-CoA dioxygenase family)
MPGSIEKLMADRPEQPFEAELTAELKAEFAERGFIRIERITSDEEIAWLRRVYDALFEGAAGIFVVRDLMRRIDQQDADGIAQVVRPEDRLPALKQTQFWQNSRRLAAQLLEAAEAELEGWGHMIRKTARNPDSLPWHQDEAYWDPNFDYRALGVWMPLDEATTENGCMNLVPGSHREGVRPHALGQGDPAMTHIEMIDPPAARAVPHPIPLGGASFHHCRTIHNSGPNRSDRPRRANIVEWQTQPVACAAPKDHPWYWPRYREMMKHAAERMLPAAEPG